MAGSEVLVVGGTRGIGLAISTLFAAAGDRVAAVARHAPLDASTLTLYEANLEDDRSIAAAVEAYLARHGAPRSLVFSQRARNGADEWDAELRVSLSATRLIIERLVAPMEAAGGGAIVVVGSVADRLVADEQPVGYHVAKAGLAQMVRYYAATLGPRGIRVNGVVPGCVAKGAAEASPLSHPDRSIVPLRRVATPLDVANVVAFLCAPESACITGQHILVDSGLSLLWHSSLVHGLGQ